MRIITLSCPECGTIVADNVLENHRIMKCPGLGCEQILKFQELPKEDQEYIMDNFRKYRMD